METQKSEIQKLMIFHGKPTDLLPLADGRNVRTDPITGALTAGINGLTVSIPKGSDLNILAHKLLIAAVAAFTKTNSKGCIGNTSVSLDIRRFITLCGVNVSSKPSVDKAKRQLCAALMTLCAIRLTWTENGKTAVQYRNVCLIDGESAIRQGTVNIRFTDEFAKYLVSRPLARYPVSLFAVSGRSPNAYRIGHKLALHNSNMNNRKIGTANSLKVSTLLRFTSLPDYVELRAEHQSWIHKVRKPFESCLAALVKIGMIKGWSYKNREIHSYLQFADNVICFEGIP